MFYWTRGIAPVEQYKISKKTEGKIAPCQTRVDRLAIPWIEFIVISVTFERSLHLRNEYTVMKLTGG